MRLVTLLALFALLAACDRGAPPAPYTPPAPVAPPTTPAPVEPSAPSAPPAPVEPLTRQPVPGRLIALGDVHGDLDAMRAALRAARVLDAQDKWIGGDATVVQTGDLLDRGDDEQEIVDLLERLRGEARAAGGALVVLNGNHEVMNVQGDLRYVTPGGFLDFEDAPGVDPASAPAGVPAGARARVAAFIPGGPYARILAQHDVIALVGRAVFVHGGVLPEHTTYGIAKLNRETSSWMKGESKLPMALIGDQSPIWTRVYGGEVSAADCDRLKAALAALDADLLVVGHTPQPQGPTQACDGKVWRVDVGMARHYGGTPAAIEIGAGVPAKVEILR
jgi:predicted phosphodiesterase